MTMVNEASPTVKLNTDQKNKLHNPKYHKNKSYAEVVEGLLAISNNLSLNEFWSKIKEVMSNLKKEKKEIQ